MTILVAIPFEPERSAVWPTLAADLAGRLPDANPGLSFTVALHACPRTHQQGDGRFSANARARNATLAAHLRGEHTHVLWADSDLVDYPADLPSRLLALNPDGISAPAAILGDPHMPDRFYDILGFVERGKGARMRWPWFTQEGPVVELDSVGCCYLAPAGIYRDGARYADTPGYTEHYAVCAWAREQGLRVCADLRLRAVHAWLPDYGESLH